MGVCNEDLLAKTQEEKMKTQIRRKKRKWISHALRKPHNNVTKQALFWNPKSKQTVVDRQTIGEDQPNKKCSK